MKRQFTMIFVCISLMADDVKPVFVFFLAIYIFSFLILIVICSFGFEL
jgi:hypothetical protein